MKDNATGTFTPKGKYKTVDDLLDRLLAVHKTAVFIGWTNAAPLSYTATAIIETF